MTNVLSKPTIGGSFNVNAILEAERREKARRQSAADAVDLARREAELDAVKNEYYEKGKNAASVELDQLAGKKKNEAYEEGYQNGKNEAFQELEPKYIAMKAIFDQWNENKEKFLAELELDAVELALAIERKIVGYEIQKSNEPLKHVIREAMKMIHDRKNLRIRVSNEEVENFKRAANDFLKTFGKNIEVIGDSNLHKGGCIIETCIGNVDAGVETRWNMVADAFFTGIERGDNDIFKDMFTKTGKCESVTVRGEGDQDNGFVS